MSALSIAINSALNIESPSFVWPLYFRSMSGMYTPKDVGRSSFNYPSVYLHVLFSKERRKKNARSEPILHRTTLA